MSEFIKTVGDLRAALDGVEDGVDLVTYNSAEGSVYEQFSIVKRTAVSSHPDGTEPHPPRFGLDLNEDALKLGTVRPAIILA